ncbi:hypothetical protein OOJ09_04110 [Mesorhizobium qingshengii]|uniref:Uncharacterized protein n=1 Tax=Mesorhizobium qingshengii TaxID=1165689 RepID=A0ABT4QP58_9HYPH|nr:hypothetical protein [Mesorhizobium qingshengii]MCZ8543350.1 hypothetical protein [Mesorhizobium qingshengii]
MIARPRWLLAQPDPETVNQPIVAMGNDNRHDVGARLSYPPLRGGPDIRSAGAFTSQAAPAFFPKGLLADAKLAKVKFRVFGLAGN